MPEARSLERCQKTMPTLKENPMVQCPQGKERPLPGVPKSRASRYSQLPPNSTTSLGLGLPECSLSSAFTRIPAPMIEVSP